MGTDRVERMLSRQEVDPVDEYMRSFTGARQEVDAVDEYVRSAQPYNPLKYCSLESVRDVDMLDVDVMDDHVVRSFDDEAKATPFDSLERSLLVQAQLREQSQHIFERRCKLGNWLNEPAAREGSNNPSY